MSKLPEGRKPLLWKDIPFSERPKAHPSSWEAEAKISRITISRLEARVAELEAAIAIDDVTVTLQQEEVVKNRSAIGRAIGFINADLPIEALSTLRAALKGRDDG